MPDSHKTNEFARYQLQVLFEETDEWWWERQTQEFYFPDRPALPF